MKQEEVNKKMIELMNGHIPFEMEIFTKIVNVYNDIDKNIEQSKNLFKIIEKQNINQHDNTGNMLMSYILKKNHILQFSNEEITSLLEKTDFNQKNPGNLTIFYYILRHHLKADFNENQLKDFWNKTDIDNQNHIFLTLVRNFQHDKRNMSIKTKEIIFLLENCKFKPTKKIEEKMKKEDIQIILNYIKLKEEIPNQIKERQNFKI